MKVTNFLKYQPTIRFDLLEVRDFRTDQERSEYLITLCGGVVLKNCYKVLRYYTKTFK